VHWWGCVASAPSPLPAGIWRYGCLADNSNVYLMSHAWSDFAAVRQAYHAGTLSVGQLAVYADAGGVIHRYRLTWVKHVTADYFASTSYDWAAVTTAVSSLTLQTCDGSSSQYRIIVRFEEVKP
jgi:hypothetical protein